MLQKAFLASKFSRAKNESLDIKISCNLNEFPMRPCGLDIIFQLNNIENEHVGLVQNMSLVGIYENCMLYDLKSKITC